ncbi:hypothetical protein HN011_004151 [Eciton burchellii]|nr:hypothetical protein HN011_004151 [Eciton burchellii]
MNGIIRNTLRVVSLRGALSSSSATSIGGSQSARALWNTCTRRQNAKKIPSSFKLYDLNAKCYYNSYKVDNELVEFLEEEIIAEKKAQKLKTVPTMLNDFTVSLDGAIVNLQKKDGADTIRISFNVNHTVDAADLDADVDPQESAEMGEMLSKPSFTIDIIRGNEILCFTCSFHNQIGESDDIFGIDELTLYEGEHNEKVYSVSGEILDGCLYDLLMNSLEQKGISNQFAEQLINFSTDYEHAQYVGFLEGLSKFLRK